MFFVPCPEFSEVSFGIGLSPLPFDPEKGNTPYSVLYGEASRKGCLLDLPVAVYEGVINCG